MRQNRTFQELRPISFETNVNMHAEGSCLVKYGNTHVLCTASIDERTPPWLKNSGKGWSQQNMECCLDQQILELIEKQLKESKLEELRKSNV